MNFKELRQQSGMTQQRFADYFGIPKRTIENWEAGVNKCPEYLLDLMKYKLDKENANGQWKKHGNEKACSLCKFIYYSNNDDFNFCPNCGAKMYK